MSTINGGGGHGGLGIRRELVLDFRGDEGKYDSNESPQHNRSQVSYKYVLHRFRNRALSRHDGDIDEKQSRSKDA